MPDFVIVGKSVSGSHQFAVKNHSKSNLLLRFSTVSFEPMEMKMLIKAFLSYKTEDKKWKNDINSMAMNPNNKIEFINRSLPEPIKNEYGHVITKSPYHFAAEAVKNEIIPLLKESDKLIIIIGNNTHSSEWVKWEIETFLKLHGQNAHILLMRHRDCRLAGMPSFIGDEKIYEWNLKVIEQWLSE